MKLKYFFVVLLAAALTLGANSSFAAERECKCQSGSECICQGECQCPNCPAKKEGFSADSTHDADCNCPAKADGCAYKESEKEPASSKRCGCSGH